MGLGGKTLLSLRDSMTKDQTQRRSCLVFNLWSLVMVLGFSLGMTGCASLGTYNPATGKNEFILISTREEVAMGNDIHQQLLKQYKISSQSDKTDKVNRIGTVLAKISDRQDYQYQY